MSAILSPHYAEWRHEAPMTPLAPIAQTMTQPEHQALADVIVSLGQAPSDLDEAREMVAALTALEHKADARYRLMLDHDHSDTEAMGAICDSITEARVFAESLLPEPPTPEELDGNRADEQARFEADKCTLIRSLRPGDVPY